MDKLKDWKDQWNHGDVKFVPDLFELVKDLLETNEILRRQIGKNREHHIRIMKQLEAQNRALLEQLMKMDIARPRQIFIPAANITDDVLEWIKKGKDMDFSIEGGGTKKDENH